MTYARRGIVTSSWNIGFTQRKLTALRQRARFRLVTKIERLKGGDFYQRGGNTPKGSQTTTGAGPNSRQMQSRTLISLFPLGFFGVRGPWRTGRWMHCWLPETFSALTTSFDFNEMVVHGCTGSGHLAHLLFWLGSRQNCRLEQTGLCVQVCVWLFYNNLLSVCNLIKVNTVDCCV